MADDPDRILDLPEFVLADGFRHRHVSQCASTNGALLSLGPGHDRLWLTAGSQLSGRGRSGREWVSRDGNLFASVRLEDPSPSEKAAGLSLVLALATRDAILSIAGELDVRLKWPNDLLVDGSKISGLLLEAQNGEGGTLAVVCGVGVNCQHAPDSAQTLYKTTYLKDLGFDVQPDELFARLWPAFASRFVQWGRGTGMPSISADWKQYAAGLGTSITARTDQGQWRGTFRDLTAEGFLVIETAQGIKTITAADVFLA